METPTTDSVVCPQNRQGSPFTGRFNLRLPSFALDCDACRFSISVRRGIIEGFGSDIGSVNGEWLARLRAGAVFVGVAADRSMEERGHGTRSPHRVANAERMCSRIFRDSPEIR